MKKIDFKLSYKYNNFKLLTEYIGKNFKLENDIESLSLRLKTNFDNLLRIKEKIINSDKLNVSETIDIDNLLLNIQALENISTKYNNDKLVIGKNTLNKEIKLLINDIKNNLNKNDIDIDLLIGLYKLVDLEKELYENPDEVYKLKTYFLNDLSMNEKIKGLIYGQSFEDLNKYFLNNFFGEQVNNIKSLEYWNYVSKRHQYNIWKKETNNNNISFDNWYFDKNIDHKYKINLPSLDLEVKVNGINYYVENKNFTSDKNNDFYLNLNHNIENILNRFKNLSILTKDNCKILYNINIYNDIKKEFYSFVIPLEDFKKFYSKIDNKINQYIKQVSRNNDPKSQKNINIPLEINNENIVLIFDMNNLKLSNNFKVKINSKSFYNMFDKYLINDLNDLSISKDL